MLRTACWVTRANSSSRSSVNSEVEKRSSAVGGEQGQRHDETAFSVSEGVDHLLEHQRHRDVGQLGGDQAGEGEQHPPL
jgi:hypothetical protein